MSSQVRKYEENWIRLLYGPSEACAMFNFFATILHPKKNLVHKSFGIFYDFRYIWMCA